MTENETSIVVKKEYYPDGQLYRTLTFRNYLLHGCIETYELGIDKKTTLLAKKHYVDGLKDGLQEGYDSKGNLESRLLYQNGQCDGVCEYFYDNQLRSYQKFKDDQLHGLDIAYYQIRPGEAQKKQLCRHYLNGTL